MKRRSSSPNSFARKRRVRAVRDCVAHAPRISPRRQQVDLPTSPRRQQVHRPGDSLAGASCWYTPPPPRAQPEREPLLSPLERGRERPHAPLQGVVSCSQTRTEIGGLGTARGADLVTCWRAPPGCSTKEGLAPWLAGFGRLSYRAKSLTFSGSNSGSIGT